MLQLIDDLLTYSHFDRQEIRRSDIDVGELAKSIFEELKDLVPRQTVQLDIKALPPVPGDKTMIRQVFFNLLSNAIKFTTTS